MRIRYSERGEESLFDCCAETRPWIEERFLTSLRSVRNDEKGHPPPDNPPKSRK
jgi:hypothetical protein